jgi:hypothetical protein
MMWDLLNFERRARRILGIALLMVLSVAAANAYTIVMRGGKRIEIPARFVVTPTTLTYEVGQGIQVTLLMTAIDIPATEKANNEEPGALLRRAQLPAEQSVATNTNQSSSAKRTITNRDLEATSRRRRESERAYDQRIKAMGLPSLAESRAQAEMESETIRRELERMRMTEGESEAYWRSRASALRTEMTTLDAEINYLRARIEEMPVANWSGGSFTSFSTVVPFISFGNFGGRGHFPGHRPNRASVYVAPTGVGPQLSGRLRFGGGATRAQVFVNPHPFGHRRTLGVGGPSLGIGSPFGILPNVPVFASQFPAYDNSYERGALIVRFNELAAARAGLNATWRELEEEARRAGAPPGWLRKQ